MARAAAVARKGKLLKFPTSGTVTSVRVMPGPHKHKQVWATVHGRLAKEAERYGTKWEGGRFVFKIENWEAFVRDYLGKENPHFRGKLGTGTRVARKGRNPGDRSWNDVSVLSHLRLHGATYPEKLGKKITTSRNRRYQILIASSSLGRLRKAGLVEKLPSGKWQVVKKLSTYSQGLRVNPAPEDLESKVNRLLVDWHEAGRPFFEEQYENLDYDSPSYRKTAKWKQKYVYLDAVTLPVLLAAP